MIESSLCLNQRALTTPFHVPRNFQRGIFNVEIQIGNVNMEIGGSKISFMAATAAAVFEVFAQRA
jgi:hypothetical protein